MPDQSPPVVYHRVWRRPRINSYKVAEPARFKFLWNRYDTCTIGAAVVIGSRCYGLTWAKPRAEVVR